MKAGDWIQHKRRRGEFYLIVSIELRGEELSPFLWLKTTQAGCLPTGFTPSPGDYEVVPVYNLPAHITEGLP